MVDHNLLMVDDPIEGQAEDPSSYEYGGEEDFEDEEDDGHHSNKMAKQDVEEDALQEEYNAVKQKLKRERRRLARLQAEVRSTEPIHDKAAKHSLRNLQKAVNEAINRLADMGIDLNLAHANAQDLTDEANIELSNVLSEKQIAMDALKQNISYLGRELASYDAVRPHSKMSNRKRQELMERIQVYQRKQEAQDAKNTQLAEKLAAVKESLSSFKSEAKNAQEVLLNKLVTDEGDRDKYSNISVSELVRLLIQQRDAELSANDSRRARGLANLGVQHHTAGEEEGAAAAAAAASRQEEMHHLSKELARLNNKNSRLQRSLDRLSTEISKGKKDQSEAKGLQRKMNSLLHKQLKEKDLITQTERATEDIEKKVSLLADHIERLMLHLKHETMDKAKAQALEGRTIREMDLLRARNDTIVAKNQRRDRVIVELQEGERILEDQLCLLDEKYNELRAKLNRTRNIYRREIQKYMGQASKLRMLWEKDTHGALPIEMVPLPFDFVHEKRLTKSAPSHQGAGRRHSSSSSSNNRQIASQGEAKQGNLHFMPFPSTTSGPTGIEPSVVDQRFLESRGRMMEKEDNNRPRNNNNDAEEPWSEEKIRQLHENIAENNSGRLNTAPSSYR